MMTSSAEKKDVIIIGAGLSGASLALQLLRKNSQLSIAIVDKRSFPLEPGSGTVGESTVELASHYFVETLGLRDHFENEHLPKLGLRYFLEQKCPGGIESRMEVGGNRYAPTPSYQIDRALLENHFWSLLGDLGVEMLETSTVRDISIDKEGHSVEVASEGRGRRTLAAKWLVDASGRTAVLKKKLNLKEEIDHSGGSSWWRLDGEFRIDDWCKDKSWGVNNQGEFARWFSTNHLMGRGYWVWIIPLPTGKTSFGIVADTSIHNFTEFNTFERSIEWLSKREPQLADLLRENASSLSDFAAMKNYSCSSRQVFSTDRWAITGEAGIFVDPFYSPGSDFIAISNSYVSDLILRDFEGEALGIRTKVYDDLYRRFCSSTYSTFRGQYAILGNPLVMPVKVFWDWSFYWHFLARLYFEDKITDLRFISDFKSVFAELESLGHRMQKLFSEWNKLERPESQSGFLDLAKHPFLFDLNESLLKDIDSETFPERFVSAVEQLKSIAQDIEQVVYKRCGLTLSGEPVDSGASVPSPAMPFISDVEGFIHAS